MPEITIAQVISPGAEELFSSLPKSYATYRLIRKHPTVALARALSMAPVIAAEWSIEADDEVEDDRIELIRKMYLPLREPLLTAAMTGGIDFGWAGFEQVFDVIDSVFTLIKIKALLHDVTTILVDKTTGAFLGYKQTHASPPTVLPVENALHVGFRVEGTIWTGESLLEYVRASYNAWMKASDGARRYDEKIAGTHAVVRYPFGSSIYNNVETPNNEIAEIMVKALESSGSITIPRVKLDDPEIKEDEIGWNVDFLSDGSARQYSFANRLEYLDKLIVRGLLIPERAILEGKFGTKADATQHADLALTHMELQHRHITRHVNWYSVNRVLSQNFGPETENTVRLVTSPLSDEKLAFYRELYLALLSDPIGFSREVENLDTDSLKDSLGVPKSAEITPVPGQDIDDAKADTAREIFGEEDGE